MSEKYYYNDNKTVVLTVDTQGHEAYLKLSDRCIFFNESDISKLIEAAGIQYGFENAKKSLTKQQIKKQLGQSFLIAKCDPVKMPETEFELVIPEGQILKPHDMYQPKIEEILVKKTIQEGESISHLKVTSAGAKGKDIFGNDIFPPESDQEIAAVLCGEGVIFKNGTFVAGKKGIPCLDRQNRLSICSTLKFNTDITLDQNTLYVFPCSVLVEGDVNGEGMAYINGDFALTGNLNNCTLYINGKALIKGTVVNSKILSEGTVGLTQVEQSRVVSNHNIKLDGLAKETLFAVNRNFISGDESVCDDCSVYAAKSIVIGYLLKTNKDYIEAAICYLPFNRECIAFWNDFLTLYDGFRVIQADQDGEDNGIHLDNIGQKIADLEAGLLESITDDSYIATVENSVVFKRKVAAGTKVHIFSYTTSIKDDKEGVTITKPQ